MEDILSSIKRIIAEEGDTGTPRHRRGQGRAAPLPMSRDEEDDEDEVLELSDPISPPTPPPVQSAPNNQSASAEAGSGTPPAEARPTHTARASSPPHRTATGEQSHEAQAAHVSAATVEATRGALGSLSRLLVKPEPDSDGTLEGLVREMLRPMVSAWLDRNLPGIVEQLVAREIAKITAGQ